MPSLKVNMQHPPRNRRAAARRPGLRRTLIFRRCHASEKGSRPEVGLPANLGTWSVAQGCRFSAQALVPTGSGVAANHLVRQPLQLRHADDAGTERPIVASLGRWYCSGRCDRVRRGRSCHGFVPRRPPATPGGEQQAYNHVSQQVFVLCDAWRSRFHEACQQIG